MNLKAPKHDARSGEPVDMGVARVVLKDSPEFLEKLAHEQDQAVAAPGAASTPGLRGAAKTGVTGTAVAEPSDVVAFGLQPLKEALLARPMYLTGEEDLDSPEGVIQAARLFLDRSREDVQGYLDSIRDLTGAKSGLTYVAVKNALESRDTALLALRGREQGSEGVAGGAHGEAVAVRGEATPGVTGIEFVWEGLLDPIRDEIAGLEGRIEAERESLPDFRKGEAAYLALTEEELDRLAVLRVLASTPKLLAALKASAGALNEAGKSFALNNPLATRPNFFELHEQAARAVIAELGPEAPWDEPQEPTPAEMIRSGEMRHEKVTRSLERAHDLLKGLTDEDLKSMSPGFRALTHNFLAHQAERFSR